MLLEVEGQLEQYLPLFLHDGIVQCLGDTLQLANPRGDQLQLTLKLSAKREAQTEDQMWQTR